MRRAAELARRLPPRLAALWRALRSASGDDAYERYCSHLAARHPGEPVMTRRAFCADAQRRKWSGINRCC
jgi:uncharacterized short protein YbdD (DUF466 family)